MRVVSVLPSATEIVFALGHGRELVARSAECDYPGEVARLPVVMSPRTLDTESAAAEVDRRVREARASGESLYTLDVPLLKRLRPDLLLTQDLCSVCSVTPDEVRTACDRAGVAPSVVSLTPRTLTDVWDDVDRVAESLHDPGAGSRLGTTLRVVPPPTPDRTPPRVAIVEWLDPPILAGLWATEMVEAAGGTSLGPPPGAHAERVSWAELRERKPDLVVVSPCSYSVERTRREVARGPGLPRWLLTEPGLGTFVVDEAFFSRPGPRLAGGIRLIRSLLEGREIPPDVESLPLRSLRVAA